MAEINFVSSRNAFISSVESDVRPVAGDIVSLDTDNGILRLQVEYVDILYLKHGTVVSVYTKDISSVKSILEEFRQ